MPAPLIIVSTSLICGRGTINHIDNFTICKTPGAARKLKLGTSHRNASKTKKEEREEREREWKQWRKQNNNKENDAHAAEENIETLRYIWQKETRKCQSQVQPNKYSGKIWHLCV